METLQGKVVVITGATRGIGRSLALRLARDGAKLGLCGRDPEVLGEVMTRAHEAGASDLSGGAFDLADEDEIELFLSEIKKDLGPVEILINNAGFNPRKAPLAEVEAEELDAILAVNLRAPFLLMRGVHADMAAAGRGHIVNVLSTVCHADMETMGAYTAAKAGLEALTRVYRKEARPLGIRVTAIYPGGTDTGFRPNARSDYMRPDSVAEAIRSVLVLPDDVVAHEFTFRPMVESNF